MLDILGAIALGALGGLIVSAIHATRQGRARELVGFVLDTHKDWVLRRKEAAGEAALAALDEEFQAWRDEARS